MGRKKKVKGTILGTGPIGKPIRVSFESVKGAPYIFRDTKHVPRGHSANVWEFTNVLKERAPLIYVFVVEELKKNIKIRNPDLQKIIGEWKEISSFKRPPTARELTAYIIERAFEGAWENWGLKRPYSAQDHDNFFRRYVHGKPGIIKDYRRALRDPQPWHRHHVGHQIKWFLEKPGKAAKQYDVLKFHPFILSIMIIKEED